MASSYSVPDSQPARHNQSCYRSLAGNGWLCAWEPSPGEKCWQTSSDSSCIRPAEHRQAGRAAALEN